MNLDQSKTNQPDVLTVSDNMNYFDREFKQDKQEIESIDRLLDGVWQTLAHCQAPNGFWPYEIIDGKAISVKKLSVSTQAMVHYALDVASGRIPFHEFAISSDERETSPRAPKLNSAICKPIGDALRKSLDALVKHEDLESEIANGTFGSLNPFTLAWLLPISRGNESLFEQVLGFAKLSLQQARRRPDGSISILFPKRRMDITTHAFPVLRALQLKKMICDHDKLLAVGIPPIFNEDSIGEWFYSRLLDHIAYATIKDGPFDAAELAFSLEGYLLCRPPVQDGCNHDRDAIERAFQILESRQEITPYWRPLKPLLTNSRGFALLPLSVEIVNSLFRSCWLLGTRGDTLFGKHREIFRTYYEWIESRVTEGKFSANHGVQAGKRFQGWYSEHLSNKSGIHTWETSQVGIYLVHYRSMLQRDVASKCLEAAGLRRQKLARQSDESLSPDASPSAYWSYLEKKYSPRLEQPTPDAYKTIGDYFIKPREQDPLRNISSNGSKRYSMLLYGPPGTGKTGLAEGLAQSLRWDFISLSPSDFVHSGVSQVEQRAKQIFDTLVEQDNCIILLDEIDRLILDRSHSDYSRQDDMFQLMTPSMLPKLKALRSKESSIFIIATNYLERIEPAAVRVGRVDDRMLVGLPNFKSRWSILRKETRSALRSVKGRFADRIEERQATFKNTARDFKASQDNTEILREIEQLKIFMDDFEEFLTNEHIKKCAAATPLASYSELKQLSEEAALRFANDTESECTPDRFVSLFEETATEIAFDVRLGSYFKRVGQKNEKTPLPDKPPTVEIIDNCWLTVETEDVAQHPQNLDRKELTALLKCLLNSIKGSENGSVEADLDGWLRNPSDFPDASSDIKIKMSRIADVIGGS